MYLRDTLMLPADGYTPLHTHNSSVRYSEPHGGHRWQALTLAFALTLASPHRRPSLTLAQGEPCKGLRPSAHLFFIGLLVKTAPPEDGASPASAPRSPIGD